MEIKDKGVLAPSYLDFTIPSEFARNNLYYVPQYGHFYCNEDYSVSRSYLDLFLFIYVVEGAIELEARGMEMTASKDQILLLDCHYPHTYFCRNYVNFLWFHFNGNNSQAYADYLYEDSGMLFEGEHVRLLKPHFETLLSDAHSTLVNEHRIHSRITRMISRLAAPQNSSMPGEHPLYPSIDYIRDHYGEDMNLELLASLCGLSISHFIRSFHKYVGCTPHEYLLSYRLRQAKQMLLSTNESIEAISIKCGFNSASHFARAFRKKEGNTPTQFRGIDF